MKNPACTEAPCAAFASVMLLASASASSTLVTYLIDSPRVLGRAQAIAMPHVGLFAEVGPSSGNSEASQIRDTLNVLLRPGTRQLPVNFGGFRSRSSKK